MPEVSRADLLRLAKKLQRKNKALEERQRAMVAEREAGQREAREQVQELVAANQQVMELRTQIQDMRHVQKQAVAGNTTELQRRIVEQQEQFERLEQLLQAADRNSSNKDEIIQKLKAHATTTETTPRRSSFKPRPQPASISERHLLMQQVDAAKASAAEYARLYADTRERLHRAELRNVQLEAELEQQAVDKSIVGQEKAVQVVGLKVCVEKLETALEREKQCLASARQDVQRLRDVLDAMDDKEALERVLGRLTLENQHSEDAAPNTGNQQELLQIMQTHESIVLEKEREYTQQLTVLRQRIDGLLHSENHAQSTEEHLRKQLQQAQKKVASLLRSKDRSTENMDYLKTIVFQFLLLTKQGNHTASRVLVPVIADLLHFDPQERNRIEP